MRIGVELHHALPIMLNGVQDNGSLKILQQAEELYKDYYPEVDQATFSVLLDITANRFPDAFTENLQHHW